MKSSLGFDSEYFWEAAVRGMIGCYEGAMNIDDLHKFEKKYGHKVAVYSIPQFWES